MSSFKVSALFIAISALALSGCSSSRSSSKNQADVEYETILKSIDESAKIIADAQRVTAESNNAIRSMSMTEQQRKAYSDAMDYVPPNMERPVSMPVRNEELENAASLLAILVNYDFNVINPANRPRSGILVTVETNGRSAYDVARDMGTQAGKQANLIIRPYSPSDTRTSKFGLIEVEYK